jgi:carnitine-CoA ligase
MIYTGIDDPARWTLPAALAEQAQRQPDAPWLTFIGGETITFGQTWEDAGRVASWIAANGMKAGDHVAIMLGSSADFVRAWLGVQLLGAIPVLLNTELKGNFLSHQLATATVSFAIADDTYLSEIEAHAPAGIKRIAVVGNLPPTSFITTLDFVEWRCADRLETSMPRARDIGCIMHTSGTSGPAKGVLMPHAHCTLYGIGAIKAFAINADDRYYISLPLFHSNGLLMQLGATLLAGISAVVRPHFSASAWIDDIRDHGATLTNLLGALAEFVLRQPERRDDRHHRLRAVLNGPNLPEIEQALRNRFGTADVISGFGMTEVNMPVWGRVGHSTPGASGWVDTQHFEVMIADPETDHACPVGEQGQILIRPKVPDAFMAGYIGMPEATVAAWRNLWFHTGDIGIIDADGLMTFVGRLGDRIRRRGENIAAQEIEDVFRALNGVVDAAAYAVPSDVPGGEDDIMVALVGDNPARSLPDVAAEADALLPRFARVRYLIALDALPTTATGKVQHAVLRAHGTTGAFDRETGTGLGA